MSELLPPPAIATTLLPPPVVETTLLPAPVIESTLASGQGPAGPRGVDGVNGVGDLHYLHQQNVASAVWTITHNLGKYPAVTVIDSAGSQCEGTVTYLNENALTLTFGAGFAGTAYLN